MAHASEAAVNDYDLHHYYKRYQLPIPYLDLEDIPDNLSWLHCNRMYELPTAQRLQLETGLYNSAGGGYFHENYLLNFDETLVCVPYTIYHRWVNDLFENEKQFYRQQEYFHPFYKKLSEEQKEECRIMENYSRLHLSPGEIDYAKGIILMLFQLRYAKRDFLKELLDKVINTDELLTLAGKLFYITPPTADGFKRHIVECGLIHTQVDDLLVTYVEQLKKARKL